MSDSTAYTAWQPPGTNALDEGGVARLVHAFYGKIRDHKELGPIFERKLEGDWGPHLDKMVDFWCSMMLGQKRYDGRPLPAHIGLPGLQDHHFDQWLVLFRETVHELFDQDTADGFIVRAERMAQSFRLGIAVHEGRPVF